MFFQQSHLQSPLKGWNGEQGQILLLLGVTRQVNVDQFFEFDVFRDDILHDCGEQLRGVTAPGMKETKPFDLSQFDSSQLAGTFYIKDGKLDNLMNYIVDN